jgi:hypothetical protein
LVLDEEFNQQRLDLERMSLVTVAVGFDFRLKHEFGRGTFIDDHRLDHAAEALTGRSSFPQG